MKDMLSELNRCSRCVSRGSGSHGPHRCSFMQKYGDMFAGNPQTLDELLEQMAEQMAAMQRLLNSMSPEQRAQLQQLMAQLLEDMDLRWQLDRSDRTCSRRSRRWAGTAATTSAARIRSASADAMSVMDTLGDLDQLENLLRHATSPGALADVDVDGRGSCSATNAARSLDRLADLAKLLEEAGLPSRTARAGSS